MRLWSDFSSSAVAAPLLAGGLLLLVPACSGPAAAAPAYSCGGFAMAGGAQLLCSHLDPRAPAQICTFSWALLGLTGAPGVQSGSFLLAPGVTNYTVFQGSGFASALSEPIVLCQAKRSR